jgi:Fe-S cluster biogenesis protein NfuA
MRWLERLQNLRGQLRDHEARTSADAGELHERRAQVEAVLEELRPALRADFGDVELAEIDGGSVVVRLSGACTHCHARDMTIHDALEPRLKSRLSWVTSVRAI